MRRLLLAVLLSLAAVPAASADPAPSLGRPFEPRPLTPERFDVPAAQTGTGTLQAEDGTDLFVSWWLPEQRDGGPAVPERMPVVLSLTPYSNGVDPRERDTMETVVARGYAYAEVHVRGTGLSGGCQEQFSRNEGRDAVLGIRWAGTAPWSDGNVGTTGLSYPGITQTAAIRHAEPGELEHLKAIVVGGIATSQYDYNFFDGVPFTGQALAHMASYNGLNSAPSRGTQTYPAERLGCLPGIALGSADTSGSMTPFWSERDMRPGAASTTAAALVYHGHRDEIDREIALAGWFDRLAGPKHLVLGTWGHAYPDDVRGQTPWGREDWEAMKLAWFDRHLRGDRHAGTDRWPTAQVQDSTGQWRAEPDWPRAGGPEAALALGPMGMLGSSTPVGSSSFVEGLWTEGPAGKAGRGDERGRLVFTSPSMRDRPLHVTGQPVLFTHVTLDRPDAHLAARLEALDATGKAVRYAETMGFRSMQHLDPLVEGRFAQQAAKLPPIGTPIPVQLRFDPASFVVPEGGRLRLTLAGSLAPNTLTASQPSGLMTNVTVHHDCTLPSVLVFQTLDRRPDLLDVHEVGEDLPLRGGPVPDEPADGGGLTSTPICP